MEKTETTIFVDWENLLADLKAIQETDERLRRTNAFPPPKGTKKHPI